MKNPERNSFTFYRNFYNTAKILSDEQRLEFYDLIMAKSLDNHEELDDESDEIVEAMFNLIRPTLEKSFNGWYSATTEGPCLGPTEGSAEGPYPLYNSEDKDKDKDKKKDKKGSGFFGGDNKNNTPLKSQCLEIINYLSNKKKSPLSKPEAHIRILQTLISQIKNDNAKDLILDVIDFKVEEWTGTKFEKHISPKTLFNPNNFWDYVDQMNSEDESTTPKEDEIEWAKKQLEKGEWT